MDALHQHPHVRPIVGVVVQLGEVAEAERLPIEAGQPVLHIGRVALLALLAVVDDIDAGLRLPPHHVVHGGCHTLVEARWLAAGVACDDHLLQVVRPRQTACVGRADA